MRLIFPGITKQFDEDVRWHNIKPLFGYFWNLCINARFDGQASISTGPHSDSKNTINVCLMLIYERRALSALSALHLPIELTKTL